LWGRLAICRPKGRLSSDLDGAFREQRAGLKLLEFVQQGCLIFGQAIVGQECLEDLLGVGAAMWECLAVLVDDLKEAS
jgi:hypothetical protein